MCNPKNDIQTAVKSGKDSKKKCTGKCKECREEKARENSALVKTLGLLGVLLLTSFAVHAQDTAQKQSSMGELFNSPMLPFYIILSFIAIIIILISFVGFYLIKVVNLLTVEAEKDKAKQLGIVYKPRTSWWSRFMTDVNAAVPVENEQSIEMDHDYDGIKELDNHLPPWWKWLFIGTIIWGIVYLVVYHVSDDLPLQLEEYQTELTKAEENAAKLQLTQPQAVIDKNSLVYSNDTEIIANGKTIFTINCVACHAKDGGGNAIGPNLTDEYWLHGGTIGKIYSTIEVGMVEKGMPAWGKNMSPKDVRDLSFYIMSLQGTKPEVPKAPQGELFKMEIVPSDSTQVK